MALAALVSDSPVIVYIDIKSPYAYLAVEPTRELERDLGMEFDWRPFVLDIPSYLGSASLNQAGELAEHNRSPEQWAGVKYAYADCRRYASLYGLTIRGTVKIWDTNLVSTAMLWAKRHGHGTLEKFIDAIYNPFWKRDLDLDDPSLICCLLDNAGAVGSDFLDWAQAEGYLINNKLQEDAFNAGIYGVPSYIVDNQMYFGREHLPRVRWHLGDQSEPVPDIAYPLPETPSPGQLKKNSRSQKITIGIEDTLDCLIGLSSMNALLEERSLTADWVRIKSRDFFPPSSINDQLRSARHTKLREGNHLTNLQRYAQAGISNDKIAATIEHELKERHITLSDFGPADVIHPALPGIVVKIDDEIFIGRQHLPLITALLS